MQHGIRLDYKKFFALHRNTTKPNDDVIYVWHSTGYVARDWVKEMPSLS